ERAEHGAHRAAGDPSERRPATGPPFDRRRQARGEVVAREAVAARRWGAEREIGLARVPNQVVANLVALREPEVFVGRGEERDPEGLVVLDEVLRDDVAASAVH